MKASAKTLIVTALVVLACFSEAYAWDVEYDASTGFLPTEASPAWQTQASGTTTSTLGDGVLHINSDGGYVREANAIAAGVPVTMEARMRAASSAQGSAYMGIGTYGTGVGIGIYSDRIVTSDLYNQSHTFWLDSATFHTIRLAYDGVGESYLWVDNQPALSWATRPWNWAVGPPSGVRFDSFSTDSYWQYVDYSKAFVPVPEPSALAALGFGLLPIGGFALRRRRHV